MVLLIITFVKATFVNYRCHLLPYKALWGDLLAFTFSEELGFGEGGHVWDLCPPQFESGNILAVCTPSHPFYGGMASR